MRLPRSLRSRLTLAFVALSSVVLFVAAAALGVVVRAGVWASIDAAAREEADGLAMVSDLSGLEALTAAVERDARERDLGDHLKFVRVTTPDGRHIVHAETVPPGSEPTDIAGPEGATVGRGKWVYRIAATTDGHGNRIEVGVKVSRVVRRLKHIYTAIAIGALALLGIMSGLAWLITSRATRELESLATEVEALEARTLDRRIRQRGTTEVDGLIAVLNRLLQRLERAVTHLRRFTADAAHELRTPIASLRTRLEVAVGYDQSLTSYRDSLIDALEQTERLGSLAEDLLSLSVIEAGEREREPVHLDAVVREVMHFLEPVAEEQGRLLRCHVEPGIVVRGSASLLKRLLLNLVDNAFRHTAPPAAVEVSVVRANGNAMLEVTDHGHGIAADDLPLVFDRFYRSRVATSRGSGLGLALCQEIARQHSGEIAIRSTVGRGTTVTVALPTH